MQDKGISSYFARRSVDFRCLYTNRRLATTRLTTVRYFNLCSSLVWPTTNGLSSSSTPSVLIEEANSGVELWILSPDHLCGEIVCSRQKRGNIESRSTRVRSTINQRNFFLRYEGCEAATPPVQCQTCAKRVESMIHPPCWWKARIGPQIVHPYLQHWKICTTTSGCAVMCNLSNTYHVYTIHHLSFLPISLSDTRLRYFQYKRNYWGLCCITHGIPYERRCPKNRNKVIYTEPGRLW